ncbi:MAG: HNH endonuclease [Nostocales cyanobacterium 94392]|nr:HNH endonuclease [Nostocales cyanobacterium 94392]
MSIAQTNSRLIGMPLVMEHIFPKTAGGGDESENLAASCYRCNEFLLAQKLTQLTRKRVS